MCRFAQDTSGRSPRSSSTARATCCSRAQKTMSSTSGSRITESGWARTTATTAPSGRSTSTVRPHTRLYTFAILTTPCSSPSAPPTLWFSVFPPSHRRPSRPNAHLAQNSTITVPGLRLRRQHDAALVRADGQVPLPVGVPDGGEARGVQRGRRPGRLRHRAAHGAPGRDPRVQHQPRGRRHEPYVYFPCTSTLTVCRRNTDTHRVVATESKEPESFFNPTGSKAVVCAFAHTPSLILTGHESGKVALFDAKTGEEVASNERAHMDVVTDLQLSPDRTYFITSSKDKTARVRASLHPSAQNGCVVLRIWFSYMIRVPWTS